MEEKDDYTLLIFGKSSTGKSTSLRTLPLEKTYFINVEGKILPFPHKKLNKHVKPKTLVEVQAAVKEAIDDDSVDIVVLDSITMLAEVMVYSELVKNTPKITSSGAPDTRSGWMDLRDWLVGLIEFCKKSEKTFIFVALEMDVLNDKEMVTYTTPKMVGSLKDSLPSHFTVVLRSVVRDVNDELKYEFQTNRIVKDMNTVCKSPMSMLDLYEPNDMKHILGKMEKFYNG
jgi:hypothetical protein